MPRGHSPLRCHSNWAKAERAARQGSCWLRIRVGQRQRVPPRLSCRRDPPLPLGTGQSLGRGLCRHKPQTSSLERNRIPVGAGSQARGQGCAPPRPTSGEAHVGSAPVGTAGGSHCPTCLAPIRNEDTPTTRACNRSAHEPLIHYKPRGGEIRQKYSILNLGWGKIRVGGLFFVVAHRHGLIFVGKCAFCLCCAAACLHVIPGLKNGV